MCTWWVHIAGDEIESLAKRIIIWVCCSDKRLLNDLKYVTDFNHTDTLEVYHSLYNKYSPKRLHFSYPFMIARVQLAVLEFNSVVGSAHRKNKQEDLQYKHQFLKITQSWVVKTYTKGKKRKRTKFISWMRRRIFYIVYE